MSENRDAAIAPEIDVWAVVTRVHRAHQNEKAGGPPFRPVGEWLAGVSYDEWFALVAEAERFADRLKRAAYLVEHLVQQVPEFTGVVGPAGEREDDYIRDGLMEEAREWRRIAE